MCRSPGAKQGKPAGPILSIFPAIAPSSSARWNFEPCGRAGRQNRRIAMDRLARIGAAVWIGAAGRLLCGGAQAQQAASVELAVKNHRFEPAEIHAPANRPIVLSIRNLDAAPVEVESVSLRVEKVTAGGARGVINPRPLQPGRYNFFDDFHAETRGTLIVP